MKTILSLSLVMVTFVTTSHLASASNADCDTVCTCAVPCTTACSVFGSSQATTCESLGLACIESCPDQKLDAAYFLTYPRYSDEELVCR